MLTRKISRVRKSCTNIVTNFPPVFLGSGSVSGWVGFDYGRTVPFYLSYTSTTAELTFLSLVKVEEGLHIFLGWQQQQVVLEYTRPRGIRGNRFHDVRNRNGAMAHGRKNGLMWKQQQHQYHQAGRECKPRATCQSKDLNEICRRHHCSCVCPPPVLRQKRLRTLPH